MDTSDITRRRDHRGHPVVPRSLQVSAALGWRLLVVAATLAVLGVVVGYLAAVVVPVAIALLLAALLAPAVGFLVNRGVPRWLAAVLVLVGGLAVLGGLLTFVIITFVNGLPALQAQLSRSIEAIENWLTAGPLHLSDEQVRTFSDALVTTVTNTQTGALSGALATAATIGEILAQMLLILFVLIFLLYDGHGIWAFLLRAVPRRVRARADTAGRRGLSALVSYARATIAVATVDAVGAGIGMVILGVPLAIPLAALVFLGAFVPIIGGVVAGGIAVLIALVANGPIPALILLGIVIGVQQLEAHILQPLLLGRAVNLHPLAVVLAIAIGLVAAGIAGALLAVPLLAVLNSGIRSLHDDDTVPDGVPRAEEETHDPRRSREQHQP
ncbi:AI-2E family transporter [Kibdelosporangium phytohabitans]|uniref:AI-2E family transporter n=1 Tax=Kibdelosporangium phytohabitans TaxID=860235 RepID=UPI000A9685B7|nr:AI-2E family transporter [Kibdelosporangium phytohabitans]MBE1468643.1 putative PurR-regulated permease PerM [Kibdelosporangium phytohabitans]